MAGPHKPGGCLEVWGLRRALSDDLSRFGAVVSIEGSNLARRLRVDDTAYEFAHLVLHFDDVPVFSTEFVAPTENDVRRAIDFGRKHFATDMMIHCFAGKSRSTAIATAILADRLGAGGELEASQFVAGSVFAYEPNRLVVEIADKLLGRNGSLIQAVKFVQALS
jgi:predicted protein tyrosine phosphatase